MQPWVLPGALGVLAVAQAGSAAGWWLPVVPLLAAGVVVLLGVRALARPGRAAGPALGRAAASPPVRVVPARPERRAAPRFLMRCPVDLHPCGQAPIPAELRDISIGGARIVATVDLPAGLRGTFRVTGLDWAVPFEVLGETPAGETRMRFDLEGMAKAAFLVQFGRLTEGGAS